jgi:hypothetical protein
MYSIYSQVSEGLIDRIVRSSESETAQSEQQKGPVASGRSLADLAAQRTNVSEHRFLHDYAYTLFEERLVEDNAVLSVSSDSETDYVTNLEHAKFVKIRGAALITDVKIVTETLERFNQIGEAITFVTQAAQISANNEVIDEAIRSERDRNKKVRLKEAGRAASSIAKLAEQAGLRKDPDYLKHISYLIRYGLADELDVQLSITTGGSPLLFTAPLDPRYLREPQSAIVKKFGRRPRKEFIVFGTVGQGLGIGEHDESDGTAGGDNLKQILRKMMDGVIKIEESFSGKQDNEAVIDPIAVYVEL